MVAGGCMWRLHSVYSGWRVYVVKKIFRKGNI